MNSSQCDISERSVKYKKYSTRWYSRTPRLEIYSALMATKLKYRFSVWFFLQHHFGLIRINGSTPENLFAGTNVSTDSPIITEVQRPLNGPSSSSSQLQVPKSPAVCGHQRGSGWNSLEAIQGLWGGVIRSLLSIASSG